MAFKNDNMHLVSSQNKFGINDILFYAHNIEIFFRNITLRKQISLFL